MDNEASTQNIVKMNVYLTDASFLGSLRTTLIKLYGENKPKNDSSNSSRID